MRYMIVSVSVSPDVLHVQVYTAHTYIYSVHIIYTGILATAAPAVLIIIPCVSVIAYYYYRYYYDCCCASLYIIIVVV